MASYAQRYKQNQLKETHTSPVDSEGSFVDMYLQEVQQPAVGPSQSVFSQEENQGADEREQKRPVHEELERTETCPDHLRLKQDIVRQGPRSDIRLRGPEEQRLKRNISELSLIEGNLLGRRRKVRSLYVTSCFNGEGKTTAALSTAYSLSSLSGRRVLLIDGNNMFPRLHTLFGIKQAPGVSDCLKKDVAFSSVCVPTAYEGLYFVPAGTMLNHDLSFFVDQLRWMIKEAKSHFDYLVWDGASILQGSQASALARFFDGMSMVIECEKTKWEVVQMAKEKIENSGGEIVGVVMNKRKFYIPRAIYKLLSKR